MPTPQKISPCLWFDDQAEEAAGFYTSIFRDSRITKVSRYGEAGREIHGRPAGTVMTVAFELEGQSFTALNGGPAFTFTPAISLFVSRETEAEVDELWGKLSDGGAVLMPLQEYPFSERYGWCQDRYGLSWQVMLEGDGEGKRGIRPNLMFAGEQAGRAEEAMRFYTSVFTDAEVGDIARYGKDEGPDEEGTVKHAAFTIERRGFFAMDSNYAHGFTFNEAISFQVNCETQQEVDDYWEKLSEGGDEKAQQCGWLKDRYGVSWQVAPTILPELVGDPDSEKSQRAMEAMLQMKKIDIDELKRAYAG